MRSALIYLALGFTFGALMLFEKGVPFYPPLLRLLPAHIEFVLFGWTMQLAILPEQFVQAFAVAFFAALAAGVYPAWKLSQLVTARALRSE